MNNHGAKIKPLAFENYLAMVRASLGAKMWRHLYFRVGTARKDIVQDGELSCSFYVSSILRIFGFIGNIHATVEGTLKDMEAHGWEKVRTPRIGDVVVWAARRTKSGEEHPHIGVYIGDGMAVNHNDQRRVPMAHPISYRPLDHYLRLPEKLRR